MEDKDSASQVFWTSAVLERIASFLPANDVAFTIRLINKFAYGLFSSRQHATSHLSQPCANVDFRRHWGAPGALRCLSLAMRRQFINLVAASGVLANLQLALEVAGCCPTGDAMQTAAAAGQLPACQLLRERYGCPWGNPLPGAARGGHRAVCEWLLAAGCPWDIEVVYEAARGGHYPDLSDWLLLQRRRATTDENGAAASSSAAAATVAGNGGNGNGGNGNGNGNGNGRELQMGELVCAVAEGCDLAALQQLHARWVRQLQVEYGGVRQLLRAVYEMTQGRVLAAAALSPSPDWQAKLEWLLEEEQGYAPAAFVAPPPTATPPGTTAVAPSPASASAGPSAYRGAPPRDPRRLLWLWQRGYLRHCASWLLCELGHVGDVAVLTALLAEGSLTDFLGGVAVAGSSSGVRGGRAYLACYISRAAAPAAAAAGHLAFLRALHAAGYLPPARHEDLAVGAARAGRAEVVAWLVDGCGYDLRADNLIFGGALEGGDAALAAWLRGRGAPVHEPDLEYAVRAGCEAALEWMDGCGYRLGRAPDDLYMVAATNGDLSTLRWLRRRTTTAPPPSPRLFVNCLAARCPLPVLRWLVEEAGCCVGDWGAVMGAVVAAWGADEGGPQQQQQRGSEVERELVRAWVAEQGRRQRQGEQQQQEEEEQHGQRRSPWWRRAFGCLTAGHGSG